MEVFGNGQKRQMEKSINHLWEDKAEISGVIEI